MKECAFHLARRRKLKSSSAVCDKSNPAVSNVDVGRIYHCPGKFVIRKVRTPHTYTHIHTPLSKIHTHPSQKHAHTPSKNTYKHTETHTIRIVLIQIISTQWDPHWCWEFPCVIISRRLEHIWRNQCAVKVIICLN